VVLGAEVRVRNPNQYLVSQTGLNNVAGTLWEIIPWSFVVDYWFNVSQFLAQWTDTYGIEFLNPYHTCVTKDLTSYRSNNYRYGHIPPDHVTCGSFGGQYWTRDEFARRKERKLGLPSVTLTAKLPWRLSAFRAWTSVSLLLQQGFKAYR
jgi:hypothetical protein